MGIIATSGPPGTRRSLGGRFDELKGVGPGFDHLRVGLSLLILLWHSFGISYGMIWTRSDPGVATIRPLLSALLPMFFALSGFLVMSSASRIGNLRTFVLFRTLRILPALATEITISAVIVGPILTAYSIANYYSDTRFIEYFGSFIGRVRYTLPGLFLGNRLPEVVNGALWTVGPEIFCYILMSLAILTTVFRRRGWMLATAAGFLLACLASDMVFAPQFFEVLPTKVLIFSFLVGNNIYLFRHHLPYGRAWCAAAAIGALALLEVAQHPGFPTVAMYFAAALLAYVTAAIGLMRLPRLPFFWRGDYSYGIYIFGFPIQQTVAQFLPGQREWWSNFAIALPLTLGCAVLSWHYVEKPVLGLRKRFAGLAVVAPRAPSHWTAREIMLAAGIGCYGIFVATTSDIFPIDRAFRHVLGAKPASIVRPPF